MNLILAGFVGTLLVCTHVLVGMYRTARRYEDETDRLHRRARRPRAHRLRPLVQAERLVTEEKIPPRIRTLYLGEDVEPIAPVPLRHNTDHGLFIAASLLEGRPGRRRSWGELATRDGSYNGRKDASK